MNAKPRAITVDATTADLLEARASARNMTVAELLADLAANEASLPATLSSQRESGEGPWSPAALDADAKRLENFKEERSGVDWEDARSWLETWGASGETSRPRAREL